MKRRILIAVALIYWLASIGWLCRTEIFPEYFNETLEGYKGLLSRDVLITDSWMLILYKNTPIGYSHTSVEMADSNPAENYSIKNRMQVKMAVMGEVNNVAVESTTTLNSLHELQKFSFSLFSRAYALRMKARRLDKTRFAVDIGTGNYSEKKTIEVPEDIVIYSPMTDVLLKKLKPGQSTTIKTLDPATMGVSMVKVRAEKNEEIKIGTNTYAATALVMDYQGKEMRSWIDSDGNLLRQDTAFGWTVEKCTASEAFAAMKTAQPTEDLLTGMAVKCVGNRRPLPGAALVRMKLDGVDFQKGELETNRQTVNSTNTQSLVLSVRTKAFPRGYSQKDPLTEDALAELKPSAGIQSDHPDIIKAAREITASAKTESAKAEAIHDWVYNNVKKESAIVLPSAMDVLKTMRGDCKEHTYLYVALARASGLPARINVGLAYHEGAFYYHAWPGVWLGEWIEMDPTWGQQTVDATHIALCRGDIREQLNLVKVMGQLSITILEDKPQ